MTKDIHSQRILILDFGSQYTQLIARRVREIGVYCEILPFNVAGDDVRAFSPSGVILSGGPESVSGIDTPRISDDIFELGCPVLGICYGMQAMAAQLGGEVLPSDHREFGHATLSLEHHSKLLTDIEDSVDPAGHAQLRVWMSHGDRVTQLPEGFQLIASSDGAPIAGMANDQKRYYGLQFHPEVTHTLQGMRILSRFVLEICGCEAIWTTKNIIEDSVKALQKQIGKDKVLLGLSGGVDSSVVAALLHRAIGDQLTCVFVDNGLLRLDEGENVMEMFSEHRHLKVVAIDARERFLNALKDVTDPEDKRRIVGNLFITMFEEESKKLEGISHLAQGTIYPDVVESAATQYGNAHVIKSHHNVGGLPEKMNLKLCEPLRELFKDEVRKVGVELGLPHEMVYRHPFPGPGLSVRILGEVKEEYVEILRRADAIFIEELRKADFYDKTSQAFAVFLPVKSVAVKGDARDYSYVIALRAVETTDFMTALWADLPRELLQTVSSRIINEVAGVSRVVYDVSHKPPATIEWE